MDERTDLVTTAEAAAILGKPLATINRWASEGRLPRAAKLPGRTGANLFKRSDVEALISPERRAG